MHHRTIDTGSQLISQSQVRPSQWLVGAGAQTQPMPCSVRTLPKGEVSHPATGEFLGTKQLQGQSPKLTPRLDPPEVGTRQLTLCPSPTNSLEPSPNLVPSEIPASGHHRFVKWGHDCQNGKIGRLGRPSRVANLGDIDAPSLSSQPLISPLVPCPGLSPPVTLPAYCSPRG